MFLIVPWQHALAFSPKWPTRRGAYDFKVPLVNFVVFEQDGAKSSAVDPVRERELQLGAIPLQAPEHLG